MAKVFNDEDRQGAFVKMQAFQCQLKTWRSCISCVHFFDDGDVDTPNFCSLGQRNIPAKVFTIGCRKWISDDEIPF